MSQTLTRRGWTAAGPLRQPVLFVNPRSGGGAARRAGVVDRARDRGIEVVLLDDPTQDLATLAEGAVGDGADALGMAGGDGSLAVVAAVAAAHGLPFVCVPAGTRNHFALDVGVDRHDVAGALDAFEGGFESQVDLAEVNGRPFLNNVSLGVYGEAVRRSEYRDAKVRTLIETAQSVLGPSGASPDLRVVDDTGREYAQPAVLLVSNNPYAVDTPVPGTRASLATGRIGVIVLAAPGSRSVPARAWSVPELTLEMAGAVPAGIDGESVLLSGPRLRFTVRPRALRVRISSRHPGVSPSALPFGPAPRRHSPPSRPSRPR